MMDRVRPALGLRIHDSHFQDHHDSLLMYVHRKQFFNANFNLFIYFAKIRQKTSAYMLKNSYCKYFNAKLYLADIDIIE